jgi:hypothetical protein
LTLLNRRPHLFPKAYGPCGGGLMVSDGKPGVKNRDTSVVRVPGNHHRSTTVFRPFVPGTPLKRRSHRSSKVDRALGRG